MKTQIKHTTMKERAMQDKMATDLLHTSAPELLSALINATEYISSMNPKGEKLLRVRAFRVLISKATGGVE